MPETNDHPVWQLPVSKWLTWGAADACPSDDHAPELGFIEPLLRRRLSPLARSALHVANLCAQGHPSVEFVYASRHGELNRTIESLHHLARNETLSPTTFSLSVLNSAPGVFAIARGDQAPATAIAAGTETFGFGLLEAYTRFRRNPARPVLFVYADTPAPAPLGRQACDPDGPLVLAMLIDAAAPKMLKVSMSTEAGPRSDYPQALSCSQSLNGGNSTWSSGTRLWQWDLR